MNSLGDVQIESDTGDATCQKKFPDIIGTVESFARQDSQNMNWNSMVLQQLHAAHRLLEGSSTTAGQTIGIVNGLRTIDADPDAHLVRPEELTPLLGDERRVGLKDLLDLNSAAIESLLD